MPVRYLTERKGTTEKHTACQRPDMVNVIPLIIKRTHYEPERGNLYSHDLSANGGLASIWRRITQSRFRLLYSVLHIFEWPDKKNHWSIMQIKALSLAHSGVLSTSLLQIREIWTCLSNSLWNLEQRNKKLNTEVISPSALSVYPCSSSHISTVVHGVDM